MDFEPTSELSRFREAIRFFRSRVPMLDALYDELRARNEDIGFTVAGVADLQLVNDVWKALDRAVAEGTTFSDFKREVAEKLATAWGGDDPSRLDTIFRTNIQTAYGAGRWEQTYDSEVKEVRPFGRFVALLDPRTSPYCAPLHNTVLPLDDAFWRTHWPPLHFRCRSTVLSVTEEQANELGGIARKAGASAPLPGFGLTPDQRGYRPDLGAIAPELVSAAKVR